MTTSASRAALPDARRGVYADILSQAITGELIGMAALVRNDLAKTRHAGSIFGVYARPDWRGTGVADALLAACVAYAGVLGLRLVRLGVVTTNASAIRLYQRCGFSVYGVEPEAIQHDGVYYDELLMARRIV